MVKKTLRVVRLAPSDPHSAFQRPARAIPAQRAEPRRLTPEQLKNPLIRGAYDRLGKLVVNRGKHLRRLDTVNGDRRIRVEKLDALERLREQILVRYDLATGVLGYLDTEKGQFVLNTQIGMALDASMSAPVVCRLFQTLDAAKYVYRRIERVRLDEKDEAGLHLVRTRVLIRFTKLFWNDLGLGYVHERVQKAAKKKREAQLRAIEQRRSDAMDRYSVELYRREVIRQRWLAKEGRQVDGEGPLTSDTGKELGTLVDSTPTPTPTSALDRLNASIRRKAASS